MLSPIDRSNNQTFDKRIVSRKARQGSHVTYPPQYLLDWYCRINAMIGADIAYTSVRQSGKAKGRLDFEEHKPLKQG